MVLITGGAFQGKLEYALNITRVSKEAKEVHRVTLGIGMVIKRA